MIDAFACVALKQLLVLRGGTAVGRWTCSGVAKSSTCFGWG